MTKDLQTIILNNLIHDETFCRKALPHLKVDYFEQYHVPLYKLILSFVSEYNKLPNAAALEIEFQNSDYAGHESATEVLTLIRELESKEEVDGDWLAASTEKWCKDRAVYLAIMESIEIIDGKKKDKAEGVIPEILSNALAVSFDSNVGHDYIENAKERYEFYHKKEDKMPFDLEMLNTITKGGVGKKTLNIILAGCVHPQTKVKIRINWTEKEVEIQDIKTLLDEGYEIEVDSPDGWVGVNFFVDKGMYDEYILEYTNGYNGTPVRCNEAHLFETTDGWASAKQILNKEVNVLTRDGYQKAMVRRSGYQIPIVDINVEHENHRYYTEDVSSHNTGVGKSLAMCHFAAAAMSEGKNVLYITLEMAEEKIAERIDANLFDINIADIENLPKSTFDTKINKIKGRTNGKLIVKEYPTAVAHSGHFRALLEELKLKKDFKPDVIFIDYLNIAASSRMKGLGGSINSYTYVKAIAEELRGLAVEYDVPLWSATQVNRTGFGSSDVEITDTSESFGLPATCDLMLALISTEQLEGMNQLMVKQLKNRYNDPTVNKRFVVGIERAKMRLYDVEDSAQNLSGDSSAPKTPVAGENDFSSFKI